MADWRCLTLHQPWATGIALGYKAIETRSWSTPYRGWVAVHSGVRPPDLGPIGDHVVRLFVAERVLHRAPFPNVMKSLPLGAVVAVARLVDVVPTESITWVPPNGIAGRRWGVGDRCAAVDDRERPWGDYQPGRHAWLLADVRKLAEPIPARGKQGLWKPDDELVAQLDAQIGAAA